MLTPLAVWVFSDIFFMKGKRGEDGGGIEQWSKGRRDDGKREEEGSHSPPLKIKKTSSSHEGDVFLELIHKMLLFFYNSD